MLSTRPIDFALPALLALAVFSCVLSCGRTPEPPPPSPHRGPIVLITFDALRADVVRGLGGTGSDGTEGLTPHLDAFVAEADWAGRAVAPSSWTVPSMASLMTGLHPWRHGALHSGRAVLRDDLDTLAEVLGGLGFRASAYRTNHWLQADFGYRQGFETFRHLGKGFRAQQHLRTLDGGPELVWVHILPPHTPYVRNEVLARRLGQDVDGLPKRVEPLDLEPYYDPAVPLPVALREDFWTLYGHNLRWADHQFGQALDALRESGQWNRALVAVTSDHGEEFGELFVQGGHGQTGHGGNLSRVLIEVPLAIKLPRDNGQKRPAGRDLAIAPGERVASLRLWATLVEAAGGEPPPETAPSLFRSSQETGVPSGILSELYRLNGVNRFSWIEGDRQLLWESSFATPEPDYYRARIEQLGGRLTPPLSEPSGEVLERLDRAFRQAPPLTGRGRPPRFLVLRWEASGATPLDPEQERKRHLVQSLRDFWAERFGPEILPGVRFAAEDRGAGDPELSPEDVEALRALGYIAE